MKSLKNVGIIGSKNKKKVDLQQKSTNYSSLLFEKKEEI